MSSIGFFTYSFASERIVAVNGPPTSSKPVGSAKIVEGHPPNGRDRRVTLLNRWTCRSKVVRGRMAYFFWAQRPRAISGRRDCHQ
jgi:hypothetical protein